MATSMFAVTFMVGYLPTKLTTTQRVMNLIQLFGAGLLVGAALIVIVPEGMSVLYQSMRNSGDTGSTSSDKEGDSEDINRYVGGSLIFGFIVMLIIDQGF
jgi:solute carrier family 39 (zinc transporter), member 9